MQSEETLARFERELAMVLRRRDSLLEQRQKLKDSLDQTDVDIVALRAAVSALLISLGRPPLERSLPPSFNADG